MLKISKSVEYAVLALKYISENENNKFISAKEISHCAGIPYDLLSKILQKLGKNHIINSQQGTKGGYSLKKKANKISLSEIVNSVDEKIFLTNCMIDNPGIENCSRLDDCFIRDPIKKLNDKIIQLFNKTTLDKLIN